MNNNKLTSITSKNKNKKEVKVEVREIKNGFIIKKTIEYNDPKTGWNYQTEEFYSKTDPFEITDKSLADLFE